MHEPLRKEPLQQPLYHRMFQMQLNHFIRHLIRVAKHDRADGRLAPPLENILILLALCAQGICGDDPAGAGLPVERRNRKPRRLIRRTGYLPQTVAAC